MSTHAKKAVKRSLFTLLIFSAIMFSVALITHCPVITPTYTEVVVTKKVPVSPDSVRVEQKVLVYNSVNDSLVKESRTHEIIPAQTFVPIIDSNSTVEEEDDSIYFSGDSTKTVY